MHSMSNLNKFQDSYQVLGKNPKLCFVRKIKSKDSYNDCLNKKIWHKMFTTNTLSTNVHKMYEWQKPSSLLQCKKFQKMKFLGIVGHW